VKLFTCELGFKKTNGVQFKFANQKLLSAKAPHIPSNGKCIFMQLGVMWIDAALHNNELTEREIKMLLTRPASETTHVFSHEGNALTTNKLFLAPLPPPGLWRRDRHVLTLTSRKDMFVELLTV
jgi:hypothetical protein